MANRRSLTAIRTAAPPRTPSGITTSSERAAAIVIGAALVAVVLALYAQSARFEFVTLDDYTFIVENPPVAQGLTWSGVRWAFIEAYSPNWHPVTWVSHMLDCSAFGLHAGPPHLVSALLHAFNALLLFVTLRYLTGALWPSALAAALFAVHPMRAESVAWLSERKDVLSGFFWILTMLAYGWYARRPALGRYAVVALLLALGLMAKTMLVSLPIILLLLDAWPLARWRVAGASSLSPSTPRLPNASRSRLLVEKLPLLALAAAAGAITIYTQHLIGAVRTVDEISLPWRIANALTSSVSYLRKTAWPNDLAGFYPHPALLGTPLAEALRPAIGAALLLALLTAVCLAQIRRRPYLAVGWLWFLIALAPVSGLAQVGMQGMADRYMYLPGIGISIMIAWGGREIAVRRPRSRVPLAAAAALALAAYTTVSWFQIGTWRDSQTLYARAIAVTEENYLAHASLGAWLGQQGRIDEATDELQEALRIRPHEPYTLMHYGTLLQDQGRLDEAARYHEAALGQDPDFPQALANLGVVRLRQDRLDDARVNLEAALRLKPLYPLAEANLGATLMKQGQLDEAAVHLQRALALDPSSAEAHTNLGVVLAQQGNLAAAADEFEAALRVNPGHANAARNLERVRERLGSN